MRESIQWIGGGDFSTSQRGFFAPHPDVCDATRICYTQNPKDAYEYQNECITHYEGCICHEEALRTPNLGVFTWGMCALFLDAKLRIAKMILRRFSATCRICVSVTAEQPARIQSNQSQRAKQSKPFNRSMQLFAPFSSAPSACFSILTGISHASQTS